MPNAAVTAALEEVQKRVAEVQEAKLKLEEEKLEHERVEKERAARKRAERVAQIAAARRARAKPLDLESATEPEAPVVAELPQKSPSPSPSPSPSAECEGAGVRDANAELQAAKARLASAVVAAKTAGASEAALLEASKIKSIDVEDGATVRKLRKLRQLQKIEKERADKEQLEKDRTARVARIAAERRAKSMQEELRASEASEQRLKELELVRRELEAKAKEAEIPPSEPPLPRGTPPAKESPSTGKRRPVGESSPTTQKKRKPPPASEANAELLARSNHGSITAIPGSDSMGARELYVGNLPTGITSTQLVLFLNKVAQAVQVNTSPGEPVLGATIDAGGLSASVEFRTTEEAANALKLYGVECLGSPLKIVRQKGASAAVAGMDSRGARELYVGNLPNAITSAQLVLFLNKVAQAVQVNTLPGEPVLNATIDAGGLFASVEFRTTEEATNALRLNGVECLGSPLKIVWQKGCVDPVPAGGLRAHSRSRSPDGIGPTGNGGVAAVAMVDTSETRELYVGNLPKAITCSQLVLFLNKVAQAIKVNTSPGEPVLTAKLCDAGMFAVVEFRTAREAENALKLNGAECLGSPLKIVRQKNDLSSEKVGAVGKPKGQDLAAMLWRKPAQDKAADPKEGPKYSRPQDIPIGLLMGQDLSAAASRPMAGGDLTTGGGEVCKAFRIGKCFRGSACKLRHIHRM